MKALESVVCTEQRKEKENVAKRRQKVYVCVAHTNMVRYGTCLLSRFALFNWLASCFLLPGAPWQHGDHEMMDVTFSLCVYMCVYLCVCVCVRDREREGDREACACGVSVRWRVLGDILRQVPALCSVSFSFPFTHPLTRALSLCLAVCWQVTMTMPRNRPENTDLEQPQHQRHHHHHHPRSKSLTNSRAAA